MTLSPPFVISVPLRTSAQACIPSGRAWKYFERVAPSFSVIVDLRFAGSTAPRMMAWLAAVSSAKWPAAFRKICVALDQNPTDAASVAVSAATKSTSGARLLELDRRQLGLRSSPSCRFGGVKCLGLGVFGPCVVDGHERRRRRERREPDPTPEENSKDRHGRDEQPDHAPDPGCTSRTHSTHVDHL
jgi:hypothetical protein